MYENGYIREDMVLHQCYSGLRDNCKEVSHIVGFVIKCSTRGDQKVRGKVLLNRIAFINCNENS